MRRVCVLVVVLVVQTLLRRSALPHRRAFAAAAAARHVVEPRAAYEATVRGDGVLVDLRTTHDGLLLTKQTVRFPYEFILGSDRGVDEVAGTVSRGDLLGALKEDDLDAAVYHQAGREALERVRLAANDGALDHAGAQAYLRNVLKLVAEPPALADALLKQKQAAFGFADAFVKDAYAKGKVPPALDAYISATRAAFERFTTMKPQTHSRFASPPADATERADLEFSEKFLLELRPVLGEAIDHAGAADALKKRLKPDSLKSNKAFVDFFSAVAADYDKAVSGYLAANLRQSAEPSDEQRNFASQLSASFAWYLKYATKPTKEQLAAHLTDAELARRAGRFLANIGDHAAARTRDLAKLAIPQLPKQRPLYLICLAQAHSERAAAALKDAGVADVYVVEGGVDNWVLSGVPTEYNAAVTAKLDDAHKVAMRGAPTSLSDINE